MRALRSPARDLRVDGLSDPLGVVDDSVRLTWAVDDELTIQDTITVLIGRSRRALAAAFGGDRDADVASHRLDSTARSLNIVLPDPRILFWSVGITSGELTRWSDPRRLVRAPDFEGIGASWLVPAHAGSAGLSDTGSVWFRREIQVAEDDVGILVHFATPGIAEVRLDGRTASEGMLTPGYADPDTEISAASVDLGAVVSGTHVVTVEVASGPYWVSPTPDRYSKISLQTHRPRLLAAIELVKDGGSSELIPSDGSFSAGRGATTGSNWYGGEDFDAGLPEPWLDSPDLGVVVIGGARLHRLRWSSFPPIGIVETLIPQSASVDASGTRILDFGTNVAGVPEVSWEPHPADRLVVIRPGESMGEDGVSQKSTGSPIFDSLRIPAGSRGSWRPRFGYHGFRYLQIEGGSPESEELQIEALVIRAKNTRVGAFASSDRFLTRLHSAVDRAVQSNMYSVFTDCPHREKLGWLEQLHLCFGALARNFDVEAHLRDSVRHIRASQLTDGAIPNIAPEFADFTGHGFLGDENAFRFDVNWGGAIVLVPAAHYREYGDRRILDENVAAMKAYLRYLSAREVGGLLDFGLGDWIALDHSTPRELISSYGYLRLLRAARFVAAEIADADWAAELDRHIRSLDELLSEWTLSTAPSQTELTLVADLAHLRGDRSSEVRIVDILAGRIDSDGRCFTVGEIAFEPLVNALHRAGRDDLVNEVIRRIDVPGYGMQLAKGMTALAETWSAEGGPEGEGSRNHFMLGMIDHWLHERVAGLRQEPASIAWASAVIEPVFLAGVDSASSTFDSPRGIYGVSWRRSDRSIVVDVTVPFGGSAHVRVGERSVEVTGGHHTYIVEES
jgi:alpha-L-rhamnosidase